MAPVEITGTGTRSTILLSGKAVEYRLIPSRSARKLRIRVTPDLIELIVPEDRTGEEAEAFLIANVAWTTEQLERARKLAALYRPEKQAKGHVLLRGESLPVQVERSKRWRASNRVVLENNKITIICAPGNSTSPACSLENWLKRQARERIEQHLVPVAKRIGRMPVRIYVMGQRTKWGNCSALGNLSFNWRLIMAPDYVLQYIVTHEMVHLVVPDHSQRFWLTVRSLCPSADRARQWLVANARELGVDLSTRCPD